jgi:predicted HNH restriction endonuclease
MTPDSTTVKYSALQPLPKKHRLSSLKKLSNGEPLSDDYIRPYVPCRTPAFIISASSRAVPAITVPDIEAEEISAREGAVSTRQHLHRERDRTIIAAKRRQVLSATGQLACSVCDFDFKQFYGDLGTEFCEVHHLLPLSEADGEVQTRLEDLAVVCSNCHRMLHRSHPFPTIEQLKSRILRE